jgi:hypothetical protein
VRINSSYRPITHQLDSFEESVKKQADLTAVNQRLTQFAPAQPLRSSVWFNGPFSVSIRKGHKHSTSVISFRSNPTKTLAGEGSFVF